MGNKISPSHNHKYESINNKCINCNKQLKTMIDKSYCSNCENKIIRTNLLNKKYKK